MTIDINEISAPCGDRRARRGARRPGDPRSPKSPIPTRNGSRMVRPPSPGQALRCAPHSRPGREKKGLPKGAKANSILSRHLLLGGRVLVRVSLFVRGAARYLGFRRDSLLKTFTHWGFNIEHSLPRFRSVPVRVAAGRSPVARCLASYVDPGLQYKERTKVALTSPVTTVLRLWHCAGYFTGRVYLYDLPPTFGSSTLCTQFSLTDSPPSALA